MSAQVLHGSSSFPFMHASSKPELPESAPDLVDEGYGGSPVVLNRGLPQQLTTITATVIPLAAASFNNYSLGLSPRLVGWQSFEDVPAIRFARNDLEAFHSHSDGADPKNAFHACDPHLSADITGFLESDNNEDSSGASFHLSLFGERLHRETTASAPSQASVMPMGAEPAVMDVMDDSYMGGMARTADFLDNLHQPMQAVAMDMDVDDDSEALMGNTAHDDEGCISDYYPSASILPLGVLSTATTFAKASRCATPAKRARMSPNKGVMRTVLSGQVATGPYPRRAARNLLAGAELDSAVSEWAGEDHSGVFAESLATCETPIGSEVDEGCEQEAGDFARSRAPRSPSSPSAAARKRGRRGTGPRGPSPASQNFRVEVNGFNISILVLRHQGHDGRHPTTKNTFYYQARIRNVYPQKHLWAGWDTREGIQERVTGLVIQYGPRLLRERPPALIKAAKRNAKLSRERK